MLYYLWGTHFFGIWFFLQWSKWEHDPLEEGTSLGSRWQEMDRYLDLLHVSWHRSRREK